MSRSHPPTLITTARRTLRQDRLVERGTTVLVAVSGGPDSMALLHVLARLAPAEGFRVVAHGVDHGLRPEAAGELALAASLARDLGVPFATTRVEVARGSNLMARARAARHAALRDAMARAGASRIATGHHADDRAETVLIRLLRGTGTAGLAVLPPRAGDLVRPLIRARRADVLAHLARHGLRTAEDPSNRDPRFLRTRVRAELLPALAAVSPRIVEHLAALADDASDPVSVPAVLGGLPLRLGQRRALADALARGRAGVRVPLAPGAVAVPDLALARIVVMEGEP